ncbi:GDSL esterase/lipase At1g28580-like isoform X1 [Primulina eburnea]|uniref:GDSL esterase/lipase At1g28580-like isoform X1 n=1 Tax=Primulina eburnea TaxID=1245227 RepID=UPI003C6BF3B8
MAPCSAKNFTLSLILLFSLPAISSYQSTSGCFESIISFGDSLADTGNRLRLGGSNVSSLPCSRLPYGETFFHHPTGRYSNGRLVVDFIAESLGLPLVEPYVGGLNPIFGKGVNFAVAGATVLDHEYLEKMGIYPETNASLGVQMAWFKQFLATLEDGKRFVRNSLILLGEIGGNDYNVPLVMKMGMNLETLRSLAPAVVNYIGLTLQELIKLGARRVLVPGNFPIGCFPVFLTAYFSDEENYLDPETGCINWLNELSTYHNQLLHKELNRIQKLYPRTSIIYVDYYNALLKIYLSPEEYGFRKKSLLDACCGGRGAFSYNESAFCGSPLSASCEDPSLYVSWDGLHLTEAAYRFLARSLFGGHYTTMCSSTSRVAGF